MAFAGVVLGVSSFANAGLISFTDRVSFNGAVGTSSIEDFESFVSEESFRGSALDLGDFTVSMVDAISTITLNFIDIPPLSSSESDVNGTSHMKVFTNSSSSLTFLFDSAITVFGADFRSLNDSVVRTRLLVAGEVIDLPIAAGSGEFSFFGFTSDIAFTSVTFQGVMGDVYGIDNVSYSATDVPEPSTLAIFALGLMGLASRRFMKKS